MSYCLQIYWRYEPAYGVIRTPDDACFCSICGGYIDWPAEQIACDADWQACHIGCLENEMEDSDGC